MMVGHWLIQVYSRLAMSLGWLNIEIKVGVVYSIYKLPITIISFITLFDGIKRGDY